MKVLVTGANGFLGSWLLRKLIERGDQVSVLLRDSSQFEKYERLGVRAQMGDVTNLDTVKEAAQGHQQIYHLAGLIAYSRQQEAAMRRVNVLGTENVLLAATEAKAQRVLLVSSVVAVAASFKPEVFNEESPYNLTELNFGYHESKRAAEALVRKFVAEGKVDGVIVNPSTVYGAGDAAKVTRSTQMDVARGKMFYYPPGGVSVVAVEDVINGMVSAMEKGRSGERYILAGENLTLRDVFDRIAEIAGVPKAWLPIPSFVLKGLAAVDNSLQTVGLRGPLPSERALVAAMYHWYDSSKARRELGFTTRPAQQAIANSVGYMKEHGLLGK